MNISISLAISKHLFKKDCNIILNIFTVIAQLAVFLMNFMYVACALKTINQKQKTKSKNKKAIEHACRHSIMIMFYCILFGITLLRYISVVCVTIMIVIPCLYLIYIWKIYKYISKNKSSNKLEIILVILSFILNIIVLYIAYLYYNNSFRSEFNSYLVISNLVVAASIIFSVIMNLKNINYALNNRLNYINKPKEQAQSHK